MNKVYIVTSEWDDGCNVNFSIEGAYRDKKKAIYRLREVVENSIFFERARNPVIYDEFALSSKDYVDEEWHEIKIIVEDLN